LKHLTGTVREWAKTDLNCQPTDYEKEGRDARGVEDCAVLRGEGQCCIQYIIGMNVRLNITMDRDLYRRLKRDLPPKGISAFISEAVRCKLLPDEKALDAAYRVAAQEPWRRELAEDWDATEAEAWPA
jgi:hypothetical protein